VLLGECAIECNEFRARLETDTSKFSRETIGRLRRDNEPNPTLPPTPLSGSEIINRGFEADVESD
jgi:hypothetical protein